jgi:hypothetical protein
VHVLPGELELDPVLCMCLRVRKVERDSTFDVSLDVAHNTFLLIHQSACSSLLGLRVCRRRGIGLDGVLSPIVS